MNPQEIFKSYVETLPKSKLYVKIHVFDGVCQVRLFSDEKLKAKLHTGHGQ